MKFQEKTQALLQRNKTKKRILPFITQYHPAVPNLKEILTGMWYLIQQQPLLNQIFKEPPIISYRKGRSLKGELRCKNELFSEKRTVREGSILTTCLVFLSFVPYIFWLKRSRKSSLDFRHLGSFLSCVVLTSSCL